MNSDPNVTKLLPAGIAAAKAGQREKARKLLMQVVEQDDENVMGWLWLCGVMDGAEEREICLENVLTLDPTNETARKGLALLQQQKATAQPPEYQAPAPTGVEAASDSLSTKSQSTEPVEVKKPAKSRYKRLSPKTPPPESEEIPVPEPSQDPLEDELSCPYCLAKTQPDDTKCRACGQNLWLRIPRRKKPSMLFKILLGLQALNTLLYLVAIALLIVAAMGLAFAVDELDAATLAALPLTIAITIPIGVYNVGMLVGLYKRWRPIFYLYLINSVLALGAAAAILFLMGSAAFFCGGPLALLGIAQFFLVLNLGEDFTFDKYRILLRPDRDLKTGPDFLERAHSYANQKMWGMAALHFRRASYLLNDDLECYLALTVACLNTKRYDLTAKFLAEAKRISPNHHKVQRLEMFFEKQHPAS